MKEPINDSLRLLKQINHHIVGEYKVDNGSNGSSIKTITLHKIKSLFTHIVTMYKNMNTFTEFEKVCIELIEEIAQEYNTIIMLL
jgi:hypothetical protein